MEITTFVKAHDLFKNKSGNEDIKYTDVMVSDIFHNGIITESTWLSMCEWRALKNGVFDISEKPDKVTWAAISALEEDAKKVVDYPDQEINK